MEKPPPIQSVSPRCRELHKNYLNVCRPISEFRKRGLTSPCKFFPSGSPENRSYKEQFENCYRARLAHHRQCIGLPILDPERKEYLDYLEDQIDLCDHQNISEFSPRERRIQARLRYLNNPFKVLSDSDKAEIIIELIDRMADTSLLSTIVTICFYNPEIQFDDIPELMELPEIERVLIRFPGQILQRTLWALQGYGEDGIVPESHAMFLAYLDGDSDLLERLREIRVPEFLNQERERLISRIIPELEALMIQASSTKEIKQYIGKIVFLRCGYTRYQIYLDYIDKYPVSKLMTAWITFLIEQMATPELRNWRSENYIVRDVILISR